MGGSVHTKEETPDTAAPQELFKPYACSEAVDARPYVVGELLSSRVIVKKADKEAGHPQAGDWIARDPESHDDQWLITASDFDRFKPVNLPAT